MSDDDKEMSEATIKQIMKGTKDDKLESLRTRLSVAIKAGKALRMENERLRAEFDTAFQRGQLSRKCECGETSTGWTEWPCCNICGAIVENNVDES